MNKPAYKTTTFWFYVISTLISFFAIWQVAGIKSQQDAIIRENTELKDLLNYKNAILTVGLKDTAKKLEQGYLSLKNKESKYLEHCKQNPCKLPPELAISEANISYTPIETLFINYGIMEKE